MKTCDDYTAYAEVFKCSFLNETKQSSIGHKECGKNYISYHSEIGFRYRLSGQFAKQKSLERD